MLIYTPPAGDPSRVTIVQIDVGFVFALMDGNLMSYRLKPTLTLRLNFRVDVSHILVAEDGRRCRHLWDCDLQCIIQVCS